jgi:hypothetical protein
MSKIPASAVNYGLLAKFSSVSRTGGCGVPLEMTEGNYSNVGHRGPVYKALGAMNPCDLSIYQSTWRNISEDYDLPETYSATYSLTSTLWVQPRVHGIYL